MIAIDTNILIYARVASAPQHAAAVTFLQGLSDHSGVVMAELVLVELYLALRNPVVLDPPLSASAAAAECQFFRQHPRWALVEHADVMETVWAKAAQPGFGRRRIIDVRLAQTLIRHGVTDFATANVRDFQGLGFRRVWNPLAAQEE